jgi:hypothetical protein
MTAFILTHEYKYMVRFLQDLIAVARPSWRQVRRFGFVSFFTCIFNPGCLSFKVKSTIILSAEVAYRFIVIGSSLINLPVTRGNDNNIIFF